jgi:hypothetical protein
MRREIVRKYIPKSFKCAIIQTRRFCLYSSWMAIRLNAGGTRQVTRILFRLTFETGRKGGDNRPKYTFGAMCLMHK